MIRIERNEDNKDTMNISIVGNAEDVAKEYAALTLNLMQKYGPVWDRAMDYVDRVMKEL
jgi:hypothetical protein